MAKIKTLIQEIAAERYGYTGNEDDELARLISKDGWEVLNVSVVPKPSMYEGDNHVLRIVTLVKYELVMTTGATMAESVAAQIEGGGWPRTD